MVAALVEKLNQDFLMHAGYRATWNNMVRRKDSFTQYNTCVRHILVNRTKKPSLVHGDRDRTCQECMDGGLLCAKLTKIGKRIVLVINPLPSDIRGQDGASMDIWVVDYEVG